jgi:hypothetical protein
MGASEEGEEEATGVGGREGRGLSGWNFMGVRALDTFTAARREGDACEGEEASFPTRLDRGLFPGYRKRKSEE